jgi:hypothetical protein
MSKQSVGVIQEALDSHKPPVIIPEIYNKQYQSGQKFYGDHYFGSTTQSGINHRFLQKAGLTAYDGLKKGMNNTTIYDSKKVEISKEESKAYDES